MKAFHMKKVVWLVILSIGILAAFSACGQEGSPAPAAENASPDAAMETQKADGLGQDASGKEIASLPEGQAEGLPDTTEQSDQTDGGTETKADYWYIDNRSGDALGREFRFSKPDEKGYPTKITLSGFLDEEGNNGTFDFKTEDGMISPAESADDPWIVGTIKGSGTLMKKDMLADDQGRFIGVDIWFVN